MKTVKELQVKIHNSFTGPYPLDPTEFNHTDKGQNYQFSTLTEKLDIFDMDKEEVWKDEKHMSSYVHFKDEVHCEAWSRRAIYKL